MSFSAEVAEYLKDTLASSNVKAGINRTDSRRFRLTPALSLLEFHISPALLPHIPTKHQLVRHKHVKLAARMPRLFGPCETGTMYWAVV